jgi:hypothetical protein
MPIRLITFLSAIIGAVFLLVPYVPLGVNGEWVWPRHPLPMDLPETIDRFIWPLICGTIAVAFFAFGLRRIEIAGPVQRGLFMLGLTGISFFWLDAVRQAAPSPHRELRPLWILFDKYASGYFFEATFNVTSTRDMLVDYESRIAKGDVLHEGTHPPGLLLLNRGLLHLTKTSPGAVQFSEILQNSESARMFRSVETEARISRPLSKSEFAALHLSSLLSTLIAAMTVIPVFGVTRRLVDSTTAWRAAALMLTVPTIGVFVPRSDVLYACTGMILTWAAVAALLAESLTKRWLFSVLAGAALFGCLLLSLAHVPVLVMLCVFAAGFVLLDWKRRIRQTLETNIVATLSFFLCCEIWRIETQCNLIHVWRMNLANHEGFYSQSVRTWSTWFVVNPIELAMAVGLPMAMIALLMLVQTTRAFISSRFRTLENGRIFALACASTSMLLWLSGKNMGEAARLWCFVTPWIAIMAAQVADFDSKNWRRDWQLFFAAQLLMATITVGRVSGFLEFVAAQ